jgi:hypothetical protein
VEKGLLSMLNQGYLVNVSYNTFLFILKAIANNVETCSVGTTKLATLEETTSRSPKIYFRSNSKDFGRVFYTHLEPN